MKKKKTQKKSKTAKSRFIFVDPKYYGGKKTAQYFKDLAKEKEYVSKNITLERTGTKKEGNIKLKVFDKATGKRLNLKKFAKYFDLREIEISHLLSNDVQKLGITNYFKYFQKNRSFHELLDTRDLDVLKKYPRIVYNGDQVSASDLITEISDYEDQIELQVYKFMLNLHIDGNTVYIDLDEEIIEYSQQDISEIKTLGYTDDNGNFILFSS